MVTTDLKDTERPKNTASIRTYLTSVREVKGKLLELMYSLRKIDFRNLSDVIGFYQNKDILFRIRETILKMACEKYFGHEL